MFPTIGFSLLEVLISLAIFSISTLGLFKHQWQQSKSFQSYQIQFYVHGVLDDASEITMAEFQIPSQLVSELETKVHGKLQLETFNHSQKISIHFSSFEHGLVIPFSLTQTI